MSDVVASASGTVHATHWLATPSKRITYTVTYDLLGATAQATKGRTDVAITARAGGSSRRQTLAASDGAAMSPGRYTIDVVQSNADGSALPTGTYDMMINLYAAVHATEFAYSLPWPSPCAPWSLPQCDLVRRVDYYEGAGRARAELRILSIDVAT